MAEIEKNIQENGAGGLFANLKNKNKVTKQPFSIKLNNDVAEKLITVHVQQGLSITEIIEAALVKVFDDENIEVDKMLVRKYYKDKEAKRKK